MQFIFVIILIAFLIGLLSRNKGDGFLDTLSSGCGTLITIIVILVIIFIYLASK